MKYLSVCSGIEAATVAWQPLGWQAVGFSENEKFPSSVLQHHYPDTQNFGDMNDFRKWPRTDIDVLVGGTPCQSFSVAGLRGGLAEPRGNLALVYLAIAEQLRPDWLVWENVPGVLSSNEGRDFGAIIGAMVKLGYGVAWRVLDAQYFGVPQRRRRVFVIGRVGDWRGPAKVLLEPESLRRDPPPSREARQRIADGAISRALTSSPTATGRLDPNEQTFITEVAPTIPSRSTAGGGLGTDFDCDGGLIPESVGALCADAHPGAYSGQDAYSGRLIAAPLSAGSNPNNNAAGRRREDDENLVAFAQNQRDEVRMLDRAGALGTIRRGDAKNETLLAGMAVRRLTPLECERLQGFPDGYTDIPGASDSGRYKTLGNSMAVPVMSWIGERINVGRLKWKP